jgi:hypothetical protein
VRLEPVRDHPTLGGSLTGLGLVDELEETTGPKAVEGAYPMAYADAFAVATPIARGATLLTGDPEILDDDPAWPVEDLRS